MDANEKTELTDLEPKEEVKGSAGLTKVGAGTLVLAGANTYMGQTTEGINGNLQIADLTSVALDPSRI